jgi:hypothetical protein
MLTNSRRVYKQIVKEQSPLAHDGGEKGYRSDYRKPVRKIRFGNPKHGGGERVRTDDLLRARQALSQLSYTPEKASTENPGGPGWN